MQNSRLRWTCIALAIIILGCAVAATTEHPDAQYVEFRNDVPTDAEYIYVAEVSCDRGATMHSIGHNVAFCRDRLRQQAAEVGADIVVITTQNIGAGDCQNCVTMFGEAYRRVGDDYYQDDEYYDDEPHYEESDDMW